jgi:hypothetical protein
MAKFNDPWDQIGDMVLRLEVSSDDPARPFVLHCHVVDGLSGANRVRLTPVGVYILGISRVEGFGKYLYSRLCSAAALSPIVGRLLASQEIFSPCHLIPRDAHAFLLTIPALEELGIKVQVPEWWHARRQPRFGVRTRIGTRAPTPLGVETLLDVSTAFLVDERELSEAEWRKLMSKSGDGLVYVADAWREVNQQAVYQADRGFETTAQMQARGGVTATEALAILSDRAHADPGASEVFTPGPWMAEALGAMGRQDLRRAAEPGPELHCQLRPYQRQGVTWMSMMLELGLGALLADDMGLGKTVQVIALILSLKRRESPGPHLIVAPASLLANWREEIERWTRPPLPVAVVHHEHDSTTDAAEPLIVLTSYSTLLRRPELQSRQWGLLVLDEAQTIKNAWAKMTHTLKRMQARMRVCLTGTPVENSLGDLWSLMDFLNPGLLGTEAEFAARVRDVRSDVQGVLEPLRRQVRPLILRRLKTDAGIADTLPQKIEMPVYCGLTTMQADLYLQAIAEVQEHLRSASEGAQRPRARAPDAPQTGLQPSGTVSQAPGVGHLQQREVHPTSAARRDDRGQRREGAGVHAIPGVDRAARAAVGRAVRAARACARRAHADQSASGARRAVPGPRRAAVHGHDDQGRRHRSQPHRGVAGDPLRSVVEPRGENQATDRAFRIGQHRNVFVHKFVVQGTVEQKIQAKIESKRNLVSDLFADDEDPLRLGELGADEVLSLVALDSTQAREEAAS